MKKILYSFLVCLLTSAVFAKKEINDGRIYLIVRADDMASFHSADVACIRSATEGISQSIEVMAPCAWFPEAVKMLNENPSVDVGVHLLLTSEWDEIKWRPLTDVPSLTDSSGYFFPAIWGDSADKNCLLSNHWKIEEIEKELRAQIELVRDRIPALSHISTHMGFAGMDPAVTKLVERLAAEYQLKNETMLQLKRMKGWRRVRSSAEAIEQFIESIKMLTPGSYLFVEHPGIAGAEMQAIGRSDIAEARQRVTDVFTSKAVIQALQEKGVILVSYAGLN